MHVTARARLVANHAMPGTFKPAIRSSRNPRRRRAPAHGASPWSIVAVIAEDRWCTHESSEGGGRCRSTGSCVVAPGPEPGAGPRRPTLSPTRIQFRGAGHTGLRASTWPPRPKLLWDGAPLGAVVVSPQDGTDGAAQVLRRRFRRWPTRLHQWLQHRPLLVRQHQCSLREEGRTPIPPRRSGANSP